MLCFHLFLSICIHLRLSVTHDWWLFSGANLVLGFLISKAGVDSYLWLLQKEQENTGCSHPCDHGIQAWADCCVHSAQSREGP